ncbi:MAG: glycosyltransferase, partial [Pseudomonadota bacterium]
MKRLSLFLPSLAGGGVERVFAQLANEFVARGHRVDLILATAEGPYLEELQRDVRVTNLGSPSVSGALPALVRHLRNTKPDALLSGLDHANLIAIAAILLCGRGIRCVISSRSIPSIWYRQSRTVRSWLLVQMMRRLYRRADAIIVNSAAGASDLEQFLRLPRKTMAVIANPIDVAAIEKLSLQHEPHDCCRAGQSPLILAIGRLDPVKDFPTLIRAFARLRSRRSGRLVILGEGPERQKLESLARELDVLDDVCLPGFVANPFPCLRNAAVLASSSLSEGCPNAVMQALACGTPVVSTESIGGVAEVLQQGRWGRLVPVGDSEALADGITATLDATESPDGRLRA